MAAATHANTMTLRRLWVFRGPRVCLPGVVPLRVINSPTHCALTAIPRNPCGVPGVTGAPGGNRTPDRRIRRPLLYPLSYWGIPAATQVKLLAPQRVYSAFLPAPAKTPATNGPLLLNMLPPLRLCT